MTFTIGPFSSRNEKPKSANSSSKSKLGFSLLEVMIAVVITGVVLASTVTTLNMWARSAVGLGNYVEMNGGCRRALDLLAYDVRMANGVSVSSANTFSFTAYDSVGGTATVSYAYDSSANTLTRVYNGASSVILEDVENFAFSFFDLNRSATTNPLSVKMVQIEAVLLKRVLNINNTDEIISAQFMLRNREVSI